MKFVSLIFLFSAAAFACVDVSGTYNPVGNFALKFEQTGCEVLKRSYGEIRNSYEIDFAPIEDKFALNGEALCTNERTCESIRIGYDEMVYTSNYTQKVATDTHGECESRNHRFTKDKDGNLKAIFVVAHCGDGFIGEVTKVFSRVRLNH